MNNVFSSPELKAQVSFSDRPLSGVRPSVCKLLHFRLLLQNRWTNFNQTWHKSSLGEGIQVCSKEGDSPSSRGDNRMAKIPKSDQSQNTSKKYKSEK
jgi:hypothetical protein